MIGILCNQKNEQVIARKIHKLILHLINRRNMPVIVFSLANINFTEKTVVGSLISEKKLSIKKVELPFLVFNLAVQYAKSDIKNARRLMEIEGVSLINITNRYNQRTIMEMLTSDNKTKEYILPSIDLNNDDFYGSLSQNENFIIKPVKDPTPPKTIYIKPSDSGFYLYGRQVMKYYNRHDFESRIYPIMKRNRLLLLRAPDLLSYNNQLWKARIYVQRNFDGDWEVLSEELSSLNENICDNLGTKLNTASVQIINCVNQFIPDMFFSFIDFVIDMKGVPYLLNFGGWDNKILNKKQNMDVQLHLCKNILNYAEAFDEMHKGGMDSVD